MKPPVRAQPVRLMFLLPITSAIDPARIRQVLIVKLFGFSVGITQRRLLKFNRLTGIPRMAKLLDAQGEKGQMLFVGDQ